MTLKDGVWNPKLPVGSIDGCIKLYTLGGNSDVIVVVSQTSKIIKLDVGHCCINISICGFNSLNLEISMPHGVTPRSSAVDTIWCHVLSSIVIPCLRSSVSDFRSGSPGNWTG